MVRREEEQEEAAVDNLAFLGGREFEVWLAVGLTVSDRVRLCGVDDERMAEQSSELPSCLLSLSEFQPDQILCTTTADCTHAVEHLGRV